MTNYTEMKLDEEAVAERLAEMQGILEENNPGADLLETAIGVIGRRLAKDPLDYRHYGPYWWSLKKVLQNRANLQGAAMDEEVAATYHGKDDLETVIAADLFREVIALRCFFKHNNRFQLTAEGGDYLLIDEDFEKLAEA